MNPYPPWHQVVNWEWYLWNAVIVGGIILCIVIYVWNTRTGGKRLLHSAIGIVVVIGGWLWLVPHIATGKEAARRTQCRFNLKAIAAAIHDYSDEHGRLPPPYIATDGVPPTSWRVDLLPHIAAARARSSALPDEREIADGYDRSQAWDASRNLTFARNLPQQYRCPANATPQDAQLRWFTAYAFLTGPGTAFPEAGPLALGDITDGTSNTLLVVEACGRNIAWTEPRDVDVSREAIAINSPAAQPGTSDGILSSYHAGRAQAAFADGSVRFLSAEVDESVLRALTTAAEGDEVGEF